jgi:glycerol-3-phosphate acyltransferase PlsY
MQSYIILIAGAYLLGSVPFGVIIARAHGRDLRTIGSGNTGATNVARALGKKWGYICFILDCGKGLAVMLVGKMMAGDTPGAGEFCLWLTVGCAAIIGHIFPIYLKFKGGKGVATSLGMVLGLYPYYTLPGLTALAVWAIAVLIWRYISLASIIAAAVFPVVFVIMIIVSRQWQFAQLWPLVLVAILMATLVVVRHVENIKRLLEGSESKVSQK